MSTVQKTRSKQGRLLARPSDTAGGLALGRITPDSLRRNQAACPVLLGTLSHHKAFTGMQEVQSYVSAYASEGQEVPLNLLWHLSASESAYLSDFPALFHINGNRDAIRTVFDLGGNGGSTFYRYDAYLQWPEDLKWTICDLPRNLEFAARNAKARNEERLHFTTMPETMEGHDLLLISGTLQHYEDPAGLVAAVPNRPRFILVNRSPLTGMDSYAVIQDVGHWLSACVVHNRARLYQSLQALGYALRDEWIAPEFQIEVAGSAAYSIPHYSGFFMELGAPTEGAEDPEAR